MDITILELHLPNANFYAPYANEQDDTSDSVSSRESHANPSRGVVLLGLLILFGLAAIARYLKETRQTTP